MTKMAIRILAFVVMAGLGTVPSGGDTLQAGAEPAHAVADDATPRKVYEIGIAPADLDTDIAYHLELTNGIWAQCEKLNELLQSVCCADYEIGCQVEYRCVEVEADQVDLMTGTSDYTVHAKATQDKLMTFLRGFERYSRALGMLVVTYTRLPIRFSDENMRNRKLRIKSHDLSFHFLGGVLPASKGREGREMLINHYVTPVGILLATSPTVDTSLAQALAEYRGALFSFDSQGLTGTGSRKLFQRDVDQLIPHRAGCDALAEREPGYYRSLLRQKGTD